VGSFTIGVYLSDEMFAEYEKDKTKHNKAASDALRRSIEGEKEEQDENVE
jgi:hypothetical protein